MIALLLIWLALTIALVLLVMRQGRRGGALTLSYWISLSLIHAPGALVYLDSTVSPVGFEETYLGFQITVVGLAMFLAGAAVAPLINNRGANAAGGGRVLSGTAWLDRAGLRFLISGSVVFLVVLPIAAVVPSINSILSAFVGLLVLGIWLRLYSAVVRSDGLRVLSTLALLPLFPVATMISGGFLGFGVQWILSAVSFLFVIARRRIFFVLLAPLVVYIGLSFFVAYMGERNAIRDAVWYEQSGIGDRLDRIAAITTNFRLLDLADPAHIDAVDGRLNQNVLVGAAAARLQDGAVELAYGGTVPWWALIPRAIWPGKPEVGGGRGVVTDFTGIPFAEGTSVGAGQVLEFYVNFGWIGVLAGFFVFGLLLMYLDHGIMRAMSGGDMRGLLLRALPGLTLIQPGGNLLEILVSAVAALIAAHLILFIERKLDPPAAAIAQTAIGRRGIARL